MPEILTPKCPFLSFNDLTIGFCTWKNDIPLVHWHQLHCEANLNYGMRIEYNSVNAVDAIGIHRLGHTIVQDGVKDLVIEPMSGDSSAG